MLKPKIKLDRASPCPGLFWTRQYFEPERHKFAVLLVPLPPLRRQHQKKKSQARVIALRLGAQ